MQLSWDDYYITKERFDVLFKCLNLINGFDIETFSSSGTMFSIKVGDTWCFLYQLGNGKMHYYREIKDQYKVF